MDSEDISSLYASLSINACDGPVQLLDGNLKDDAIHRMSLCLVGKILTSKRVNREAFMRVIGKIWLVNKGMSIESVTGNTFAFHFGDENDLNKVVAGSPWCFDNALIAMERPVDKEPIPITNGKEEPLFGAWLRATGPLRKFHNQNQKGLFFSLINSGHNWRSGKWKEHTMAKSTDEGDEFTKIEPTVRKEVVIPEVSTSKHGAFNTQLQNEAAGDVEYLGKVSVNSMEINSNPVLFGVLQQNEKTINLVETGVPQAVINNEVMVEASSGMEIFGPQGNNCGPLPYLQELQDSTDMGSKKASVEPIKSLYTIKNNLDSDMDGSGSRPSGTVDYPCGAVLISERVRKGKFGARRPSSIHSKESGTSGEILEVRCGKRKGEETEIADGGRIKKARKEISVVNPVGSQIYGELVSECRLTVDVTNVA
ncbi:hypothetical protein EZV62_005467 [Acer yangbiense]|uniref:DUF4283 domain-containing protein n=1 Tax=Acer yangbiense TaxID=1000413 RepID=A0A5C7IQ77_9ROSI|nr:hypothetical protein EZV62_005467 [Acer yangbiense]